MAGAASALQPVLALEVDPGLGGNIDPAEWDIVRRACRAEVLRVPRGPWALTHETVGRDDLVAFVIAEGLLAREISVPQACVVEFLGDTDVLQSPIVTEAPWLGTGTRLTAVSDLLLLVLGNPFVRAAARWPTLMSTLQRRLELQRESLAIQGLIAHLPNAEHRLLVTLWHLAERWGYVSREGIVLPWPLNHEILGRLIGARRPTVTIALRDLEAGGRVRRRADGSWLLTGAAEGMINAIAGSPGLTPSIGERMMLYAS